MKTINLLSWGGGTQSTALMIKMLNGEVKDSNNKPVKLDYIMFADTKNESEMVYAQIYKVQKYVKDHYNFDIIITAKNKELKPDVEIIKMIQNGDIEKYRSSEYVDLFQSHILFFKGIVDSIDIMPFWTRNKKTGVVGKTAFKQCTFAYKIDQLLKEVRIRENIIRITPKRHKINMFIGYSIDEIGRVKPNPKPYAENITPLVDLRLSKQDCIDYVEKHLGFKPISSVCNICYANDFNRVYKVYEQDKNSWEKLLLLDDAMANKHKNHKINDDVFMFKWQAEENVRLKDISMEDYKEKYRKKYQQLSIFDMEQEMACMGGCFL